MLILIPLLAVSCGRKGIPTLKSFEKPVPVKEITAVHRGDEIIISWSYPPYERGNVKGFYMEKAEGSPNFTAPPLTFQKNDAASFADREFRAGKEYFYRIRVYSLRDVLSDDSPVLKVRPAELPPAPKGLSFALENDSVEIKWIPVRLRGEAAATVLYNVYKSFEEGRYSAPVNKVPLKDAFYKDRVETGRTAYYTVKSVLDTSIRDEGYPSAELEVNPESFVPSRPTGLKYVVGESEVYLMWNEGTEAWLKGYRIYRKRYSESEFRYLGEAVTPAFTDKERLTAQSVYYVTALGPKRESAPSVTIEVAPLTEE